MHMDMSQEPFYARIYKKKPAPKDPGAQCVRACAIEMHMDMSQEPFRARTYRKNAAPQKLGARFVRACAVETHPWTCDESFYAWSNLCLYTYHENPSVWTHCLGNQSYWILVFNNLKVIQFRGLKFNTNLCRPALSIGKSGIEDMDAETILVHRDIVYKESGRRRSYSNSYHRRREYHRRRRSQGQKQRWMVCLVDIGCADGLRLTPSITCPFPQELAALPRCQGSGAGKLCIANKGECSVPEDLENCQDWYGTPFSVYQKETGTTRTSTTYTRTNTVVVVAREPEAEAFHLEWPTIAALVVAALLLGGIAVAVIVRESKKATSPDGGPSTIWPNYARSTWWTTEPQGGWEILSLKFYVAG